MLIHFEYKLRQDFESQVKNKIQVKKEENKEFSYKKCSYEKLIPTK